MTNSKIQVDFSTYANLHLPEIFAYDKLPRKLRDKIKNLNTQISCKTVLQLWNMLHNEKMVLQAIEQMDEQLLKMENGEAK
jgi:hypothetical protein